MHGHDDTATTELYGVLAEYDSPDELMAATTRAAGAGYRKMEAYTPFPIDGLAEAMGFEKNAVAPIVLTMGIIGGLTGFGMQWYSAVVSYPLNIGGRPFFSWPAFIPITFELTVLFASIAAVVGMLALNGLPKPYHPIFNAPIFDRASTDGFFLCIEAEDPSFDLERVRGLLEETHPRSITVVPHTVGEVGDFAATRREEMEP
jgi:hypothetical protein